jgi:hypothetical protein
VATTATYYTATGATVEVLLSELAAGKTGELVALGSTAGAEALLEELASAAGAASLTTMGSAALESFES